MAEQLGEVEQRLSQARSFKSEGNTYYSEHRVREAVRMYHRALLQLRGLDPNLPLPLPGLGPVAKLTPQQIEVLESLQADCYNNLAACLLQSQPPKYERVYECSMNVLRLQPHNVKALYRAGVSCYHLKDYTEAHSYLSEAGSQNPKDTNIKNYIELTNAALQIFKEEEKQKYQGMFG